ncbi:MAG: hypothetical protein JST82_05885 [Bacteroidetes bacterium]|nr:hypothetical protein [Bacteroidota bacterium]
MKRISFVLIALVIILVSCGKTLKDLITIHKNLDYKQSVDIPNITKADTFPAQGISVDFLKYTIVTNSSNFVKENNTSTDLLTSVKAASLGMTLTNPANGYLNFMDSVRVYISADNLPEQLAAYRYNIPNLLKTIDLTCNDIELKEYFIKDSMYVRIAAHFTKYPDSNSKADVNTTLSITANPLK